MGAPSDTSSTSCESGRAEACQGDTHKAGAPGQGIRMSPLQSFVLGSLAACGAVTVTNPLDVVKTRLVLQGQMDRNAVLLYRGPFSALFKIMRTEGPAALLKGLVPAYATQVGFQEDECAIGRTCSGTTATSSISTGQTSARDKSTQARAAIQ